MSEDNNLVETAGNDVPPVADIAVTQPSSNQSITTALIDTITMNAYDSSNDDQYIGGKEPVRADKNGNNQSSTTQNKDTNKAGKDKENDDEEGEEDEEEGVTTYSGYVPISQISWDWEPPTSVDNQKKVSPPKSDPPPDKPVQDQGDGNNSYKDYGRRPVEGLVYTEVGEKAKPTPYIWEIKARKFERAAKNKLFVGGLTFEAKKEFLYDQFEKYGELDDACIVTEKGTGKSRGFGYVTFVNKHDAQEAIKAIDGLRINGKTLCVEFADDPKSSRGPPAGRGYRGGRGSARGRHDMDRYSDRDPYYDRGPDPYHKRGGDNPYYDYPPPRDRPPPRSYDRFPPHEYGRPPPRDYDRPPPRDYYDRPPPRDYYDRALSREYDRPPIRGYDRPPPPRDYYDRPPARDPYDRPPPRDYDDYRRPPASYEDRYAPPVPRRPTMTDVDVARLRVDRERVRGEKLTSVEHQRLLERERKKKNSSTSSGSDSSDTEAKKAKAKKRHKVIPKAYMM